jgi:hypothetical protein
MSELKLIAFDADDLAVVSANLQDAVVRVQDMAYLKAERRFAMVANRFDWLAAQAASGSSGKPDHVRRHTAVRFERVLAVKVQAIDLKAKRRVLSLLAIGFEARGADDPAGFVTLTFAGGGAIRLEVECIEAELKDLGGAWAAKRKPEHGDGSTGA